MVSVIIPNYNHAPFLQQRIDTILFQSYQDFEIIILDDASTDNSKAVIESYRNHAKVSAIVYNQDNSGSTFKQWDKGIQMAKGEWIWIAESDDWCEANLLETLVAGIDENTAIAIAQSVVVKDDGEIRWKSEASHFSKTYSGIDFIKKRMLLDNFGIPNASMCIFKKSLYYNIDKAFTSYRFCGDWLFWVSIAQQGSVFISGKYLNYFRKHDKDVSGGAYNTGVHFSEYFTLLDSLEQKHIVSGNEKHELLRQKFEMFIGDDRLSEQSHTAIGNRFKKVLKKDYYKSMLILGITSQLKKLKKILRS